MATRGQTHQKRAREQARRERRELKQAKKEARAAGETPPADNAGMTLTIAEQESAQGWIR